MVFGFQEATLVIGVTALSIFALPRMPRESVNLEFFKILRRHSMLTLNIALAGWVFIAAVFGVSGFYFIENAPVDSPQLIAGIVLYLVNLVLVRFYHIYMWDHTVSTPKEKHFKARYLLYLHGLILLTAIGAAIDFGCIGLVVTGTYLWLIPTITWSIYALWLFYGTYLHWSASDKFSRIYMKVVSSSLDSEMADKDQ